MLPEMREEPIRQVLEALMHLSKDYDGQDETQPTRPARANFHPIGKLPEDLRRFLRYKKHLMEIHGELCDLGLAEAGKRCRRDVLTKQELQVLPSLNAIRQLCVVIDALLAYEVSRRYPKVIGQSNLAFLDDWSFGSIETQEEELRIHPFDVVPTRKPPWLYRLFKRFIR